MVECYGYTFLCWFFKEIKEGCTFENANSINCSRDCWNMRYFNWDREKCRGIVVYRMKKDE